MISNAQKKANARYHQTEKGKVVDARYDQSEKGKVANAHYAQTEKGKIARSCYDQTEKGKATNARIKAYYKQSEKGKIANARAEAKRKELGFELINDWFSGSHGHHIDKENVLFIPAELHRSIKHAQSDSASMKLINDAAYEWLCTQEIL